jgi:hypothetical protein
MWLYVTDMAPGTEGLGPFRRRGFFLFMILFSTGYIGIVSGLELPLIVFLLALITALCVIMFSTEMAVVLVKYRDTKGLRQKIEKHDQRVPEDAVRDFLVRHFGRSIIIVIIVALVLLGVPLAIGSLNASTQKDFLIPSTYPDSVVLTAYGDDLVCAPFENQTVKKSFFVVKMDDEPRPLLELKSVGPLSPAKDTPRGN